MASTVVGIEPAGVGEESRELARAAGELRRLHHDAAAVLRAVDRVEPGLGVLVECSRRADRLSAELDRRLTLVEWFERELAQPAPWWLPGCVAGLLVGNATVCTAVIDPAWLQELQRWIDDQLIPLWKGDDDTFPILGWLSSSYTLARHLGMDPLAPFTSLVGGPAGGLIDPLISGTGSGWMADVSPVLSGAGAALDVVWLVRRGNPLTGVLEDPTGYVEHASGAVFKGGVALLSREPAAAAELPFDAVVAVAGGIYLGAEVWDHRDGIEQVFDGAGQWVGVRAAQAKDLGVKVADGVKDLGSRAASGLDDLVSSGVDTVRDWVPGL
ncbi:MAG: hypothetical protein U0V73_16070 [Acidimicrobiia bacterium]